MKNDCVARALDLARAQSERLARGDFDAYAVVLPEYARVCELIASLSDADLRAAQPELAELVAMDRALAPALAGLQDKVLERMGSLRRAERVTAAYFAVPELRGDGRRSA